MARATALELLGKYEAMHRLRSETTAGAPTLALRELAERFPGALRELDELALEEIERRLAHLRALAEGHAPAAEAWVVPLSLYHRRLRGALSAKRWLQGRRQLSALERRDFEALRGSEEVEAAVWAAQLERLASPPTGRLTDVVLEHVALELGLRVEVLSGLLFGEARARRARRRRGA
ncbi:MAG: hypothetical protein MUF34_01995 [Polyangiaceae bacterium]|nr:hypothetical protein [Polyangiaceae bacterium]